MNKLLLLLVFTLISCGNDTDFSGNWVDKKSETDRMVIKKSGNNYIVEVRNKKYPAQVNDGLLEISAELPIKATIDDNDNLIINGDEYVRFKNAIKPKFIGNWKNSDDAINPYSDENGNNLSINMKNNNFIVKLKGEVFKYRRYKNGIIYCDYYYYGDDVRPSVYKSEIKLIDENQIILNISGYSSDGIVFKKIN